MHARWVDLRNSHVRDVSPHILPRGGEGDVMQQLASLNDKVGKDHSRARPT